MSTYKISTFALGMEIAKMSKDIWSSTWRWSVLRSRLWGCQMLQDKKERGRGFPRSRMDDLCLGVNLFFVLFHHFAGQKRSWVGKMINRLLPLFPSVIPSYCFKTQKFWNFLSIRSCILKKNCPWGRIYQCFLICVLGAYWLSPVGGILGHLRV